MANAFELQSFPDGKKIRYFLIQYPVSTKYLPPVDRPSTIAQIDGAPAETIRGVIRNLLPDAPPALLQGEAASIPIDEDQALRLGLVFLASDSLRATHRIQAIVDGALAMSDETAVSWMQMFTDDPYENAVPAFRVYITGDK